MPTACIHAYTIVAPTNLKPRRFRSLEIFPDSAVWAGTDRPSPLSTFPSVNDQQVLPKVFSAVAHLAEHSGAGNGRLDLGARPDDGRVPEESFDVPAGEPGDGIGIEAFERLSKCCTLAKDDRPRQPGLKAFEHEHFPQRARVALRNAPLLIVIRLHERVLSSPTAT